MPPSAISPISPPTPTGHDGEQDVDLTSMAIEHKMAKPAAPTPESQAKALPDLDASKLEYELTKQPRPVPEEAAAWASPETICTDHMILATWSAKTGWSSPRLQPYGPPSLMPTASVLHYATECFEGLKAYRGHDGALRLFRPACNAARMVTSAVRISLPAFSPAALAALLTALLATDGPRWLPRSRPGPYLYVRPAMIATTPQLGVKAPSDALLFITACFLPRLDDPRGGMKLHTSPEDMVRAWAGGFGYAKVGANYGPSLLATQEAKARGYTQVLWLYGPDGLCTEAGASNFFVVWRSRDDPARVELVTAPLDDLLILDGVNRRSVVQLARERLAAEGVDVVERRYTIGEVLEADREGRLLEAFAAGTAVRALSDTLSSPIFVFSFPFLVDWC